VSDFKKARDEAAKLFVTDGDCEIMDTTMAHEDTFKAGSNWARDFILNSEEIETLVNSAKRVVELHYLSSRPSSCNKCLLINAIEAFEKLKET